MCGIAAIVDRRASPPETATAAIVAVLRHRGPDGEAIERIGPATLIHTRLAIIDLAGVPSRFADRHVKVVLSGQGADEPFGDYERYQAATALPVTRFLRALLATCDQPGGRAAAQRAPQARRPAARRSGRDRAPAQVFEISDRGPRARLTGGPAAEAAEGTPRAG